MSSPDFDYVLVLVVAACGSGAVVIILSVVSVLTRRQRKHELPPADLRRPLLSLPRMVDNTQPRDDMWQYDRAENATAQGLTLQLTATVTVCTTERPRCH